jgi:hypothetical protein
MASKRQDLFIPRHSVILQKNRILINTVANALKLAYSISVTLVTRTNVVHNFSFYA